MVGIRCVCLNSVVILSSDFLEKIQSRIEDYTEQVKNADLSDLQNTATVSSKQLANNFLAGEWLQRGESYGVIQIIAALLILRSQGSLDGLCSFLFGPLVLLTGAIICGKSKVTPHQETLTRSIHLP